MQHFCVFFQFKSQCEIGPPFSGPAFSVDPCNGEMVSPKWQHSL